MMMTLSKLVIFLSLLLLLTSACSRPLDDAQLLDGQNPGEDWRIWDLSIKSVKEANSICTFKIETRELKNPNSLTIIFLGVVFY
jgi:hypothetical protein